MIVKRRAAPGWFFLFLAGACGPAIPPDEIARWDGGTITAAELDGDLLSLGAAEREPAEGESREEWLRRVLLRRFLAEELARAPERPTLEAEPAFRAAAEARERAALTREYLATRNARFDVTAEEAKALFDRDRGRLRRPERRAFRYLLVGLPPGGGAAEVAAARAKAESIRREAQQGASFEELVRRHSTASNAAAGGLVGAVTRGDLRGDAGAIVFALEPGAVSDVFCNRAGCQIFLLEERIPAVEPDFALARDEYVRRIATDRRRSWLAGLLREEGERQGATLPSWIGDVVSPRGMAADEIVLAIGETKVLARELAGGGGAAGFAERLRTRAADLLFPVAFERENPAEAKRIRETLREASVVEAIRRRRLGARLAAGEGGAMRAFYEAHKDRYRSDPRVELSVFSFPILAGDPITQAQRLARFADSLRKAGADGAKLLEAERWPGGRREALPESSVRDLVVRRPELSMMLAGELTEGLVAGPFRSGAFLWVVRIDILVPSRQLSFLEVQERAKQDLIDDQGTRLLAEWSERLAIERNLRVREKNLARFGELIAAKTAIPPPASAAPPAAGP